ncbi:O-antigen polymerase [Psychrobacter sp.]|uniref:O-antigen polymerase n=1 Tax=Psychrobacter sp. TaxID=56811 RepID=UPI002FDAC7AD
MRNKNYINPGVYFSDGIKFIPVSLILIILNSFLFINKSLYIYISFSVIILAIFSLIFLYRIKYREFYALIFLVVLMLIFNVVSTYITNNTPNFGVYFSLLVVFILGYLILNYDKNNLIIKTLYYLMFIYLAIVLLLLFSGRNPNDIWIGSQNSGSQVFVITCSIFIIYFPVFKLLKFKSLFYFLIFVMSILSFGRSGIITSAMLLIAVILKSYSFKLNRKNLFYSLMLIITLVFFFFNISMFLDFFNSYSKFDYLRSSGIEDSYRSNMIREFFDSYDLRSFLFGTDLSSLPYIASFNNNPHNGFIYLHAKTGFLAIIIYIGIFLSVFKFILKKDFAILLAIIAMLSRFSTDSGEGIILLPLVFLTVWFFNGIR